MTYKSTPVYIKESADGLHVVPAPDAEQLWQEREELWEASRRSEREKAFAIRNKQGEFLLFTICHQPDSSITRLLAIKQQSWNELQAEGYEVIEVVITPAN